MNNTEKRLDERENRVKLSIIVPCYKVEQYLPRCLDSLVNQTLEGIEIVAINDGSPDNCLGILKEYRDKYGIDRIVIIDKKNEGVWRGRKDGIKKASGEFIGFVDSDDYVALDYAEKLYNAAVREDADISVCGFDRIDMETGNVYSREMCKKREPIYVDKNPGNMLELNGAPWNKIYRARVLKEMHEMSQIPRVLDDMMFLQLAYLNANKIVFIQDSLVYYMVRKGSIINSVKKELINPTYESMKEVKSFYANEKPNLGDYIDAIAFLHLGVSLMYRMYSDKSISFREVVKDNRKYLNEYFPRWKKTEYTRLPYVIKHKGTNFKLWVVKMFINLGLFRPFIWAYTFMIKKFGVDIKW